MNKYTHKKKLMGFYTTQEASTSGGFRAADLPGGFFGC